MSDVWLGKAPPMGAGRDATHVAVVPAVASEELRPGTHVGVYGNGGRASIWAEPHIGIVDPYLATPVKPGERFYLCLYPRSVTGLRHVYTHPALDDEDDVKVAESEKWLRNFIASADCPGYDTVIAAAVGDHHKNDGGDNGYTCSELADYGDGEKYLHFGGRDAHGEIPPEFWDHVEIVTGRPIPNDKRAKHFSCSC